MYKEFAKFINNTNVENINSDKDFVEYLAGKSLLNGMYRLFKNDDVEKWNSIVEEGFSKYKGYINVFGYDWLGRIFAINKIKNTVLLFEPGTGEVLDIPANFENFHNIEIAEYHEDSLASHFFEEWYEANNHYELKINECVGYKVPLFLNGNDTVDNLEVLDMEVYWHLMIQMIG